MSEPTLITVLDVPVSPQAVWTAWTTPEHLAAWWGPAGFTSTVTQFAFAEGGRFDLVLHGPDGTDYPNRYRFDELDEPRRIVWTNLGSAEFGLGPFTSVLDLSPGRLTLIAMFTSPEEKRRHVEDFGAEVGSRDLLERLVQQARSVSQVPAVRPEVRR